MSYGNGSHPGFWRDFLSLLSSGLLLMLVGSAATKWHEIGILSARLKSISIPLEQLEQRCQP
ncbi:MAG: hypothetical protein NW237_09235 [Cyanobacteriota bacterium]|nr:hypothetical protein [Cyanobacteriota bacterium]